MFPAAFGRELLKPVIGSGQFGKHSNGPGVFHSISQSAALSNESKPVLIVFIHVLRIYRKERVRRGVLPDPLESAQPVVCRGHVGPFNVWTRRKELALSKKPSGAKRQEESNPSPCVPPQNVSADQATS